MKSTILLVCMLLLGKVFAQSAGELDLTFDPVDGSSTLVEAIAIQDDGKILIVALSMPTMEPLSMESPA